MEIERVHPELQLMARKAPQLNVANRVMRAVGRFGARYLLPKAKVAGVQISNEQAGPVGVRLYRPATSTGAALVWIHGGGLVIGAPRQDDRFCAETAAELGITIVSVDYRLAPEHPFPAPLQDCLRVWSWLQLGAEGLGIDAHRVAVGGGSAGGGLAAAAVNELRDQGGTQPVAQWLLYPMLDDRTAAQRDLDHIRHFVWNNEANRFGWSAYLGGSGEPGGVAVSPMAAAARQQQFKGLPPTWIGVGDIDLFFEEDRRYAEALSSAGVPVQFDTLPGGPHGFESLGPEAPVVRDFVATARAWLSRNT